MISFIAQRIAKAVVVLLALVVLNFFLIRMAPGDPALVMAGEAGAGDQIFLAQLREKFGLDQPLPVQLFLYVKGILSLDLGFSFRQQMPVATLILQRLPATLLLTGTAFAISLAFGILFGALAARFAGTWADTAITVLALIFYATPLFWVGADGDPAVFGRAGLAAEFRLRDGRRQLYRARACARRRRPPGPAGDDHRPVLHGDLCPHDARLDARGQPARLRQDRARQGPVATTVIQRRHVLRNALLPVVTLAGLQAGTLVGGAVLTETVFAWPGIGRLMYEALLQRDYNLLLGVFVVCSAMVLAFNLITDLVYRSVDPRIEFAS